MTTTRTYETCTVIIDRSDESGPYTSRWSGYGRIDAETTAAHIRDNGGAAVVEIKTYDVEIPAGYESIYQPGIAERTTLHGADCPICAQAVAMAETLATSIASLSTVYAYDHRDLVTGEIVVDHQATYTRRATTPAVV